MWDKLTKLQKVGGGLDVMAGGAMSLFPEYKWIAILAIIIGTVMMIWPFINIRRKKTFDDDFDSYAAIKDEERKIAEYKSDARITPVDRDKAIALLEKKIKTIKRKMGKE